MVYNQSKCMLVHGYYITSLPYLKRKEIVHTDWHPDSCPLYIKYMPYRVSCIITLSSPPNINPLQDVIVMRIGLHFFSIS